MKDISDVKNTQDSFQEPGMSTLKDSFQEPGMSTLKDSLRESPERHETEGQGPARRLKFKKMGLACGLCFAYQMDHFQDWWGLKIYA